MDFKVIFKDTFLEDLEQIVRSIAEHSPQAAHALGKLILNKAESLSFFPERYPTVRQRPGIRRFIVREYFKVFYRVLPDSRIVEILRCWDGRREMNP